MNSFRRDPSMESFYNFANQEPILVGQTPPNETNNIGNEHFPAMMPPHTDKSLPQPGFDANASATTAENMAEVLDESLFYATAAPNSNPHRKSETPNSKDGGDLERGLENVGGQNGTMRARTGRWMCCCCIIILVMLIVGLAIGIPLIIYVIAP
jgi:hypothetical protein